MYRIQPNTWPWDHRLLVRQSRRRRRRTTPFGLLRRIDRRRSKTDNHPCDQAA